MLCRSRYAYVIASAALEQPDKYPLYMTLLHARKDLPSAYGIIEFYVHRFKISMYRRYSMCRINVTEFRKNLFHYIKLSSTEDVQITNNGEVVAVLSSPDKQYCQTLLDLCGCLKDDDNGDDYKDIIGEEILRKCGF